MKYSEYITNPRLFIETFLKIIDKKGRLVPFYFNSVQEEFYDYLIKTYWKPYKDNNGIVKNKFQHIRETELKSRQYGGSTFIRAITFYNTITNKGINNRIYCQDYEYSKQMLQKDKIFLENMPVEFRPELGYNTVGYLTFPKLLSSIKAEKPGASESVARKQGRSTTIQELHISELSEWVNAEITLQGLLDAVSEDGNVFSESSPKKIGDRFHIQYTQGKTGKSEWHSRFVPWFVISEYRKKLTKEQKEEIEKDLTEREILLIDSFNLSAEQIAWRRAKISEKLGNEKSFLKEFPENDIECFESGAELIFPDEVRKKTCTPKEPVSGHIYTIGVDVGGGGPYSDDSAIVVIDSITREQVYQENLIINPEELPLVVYEIWKKYPGLVGFESNNDCGLTALEEAYKILDWIDFLFSNNTARGGWWTGHNKKPTIFGLRLELKAVSQGYPGLKISSEQIITEMGHFQDLGNGAMGSPPRSSENRGNSKERLTDDSIMALMIAFGMLPYVDQVTDIFYERFVVPLLKENSNLLADKQLRQFYNLDNFKK